MSYSEYTIELKKLIEKNEFNIIAFGAYNLNIIEVIDLTNEIKNIIILYQLLAATF